MFTIPQNTVSIVIRDVDHEIYDKILVSDDLLSKFPIGYSYIPKTKGCTGTIIFFYSQPSGINQAEETIGSYFLKIDDEARTSLSNFFDYLQRKILERYPRRENIFEFQNYLEAPEGGYKLKEGEKLPIYEHKGGWEKLIVENDDMIM